ncbi:MAG: hypothetical protein B6D46_16545 [Polyangiaceae bacterium UTPRO1]|nr:MAG: hypothetical protein B6D46_16545 [Polyangiaceae bacterium UTPRO1]
MIWQRLLVPVIAVGIITCGAFAGILVPGCPLACEKYSGSPNAPCGQNLRPRIRSQPTNPTETIR